MSVGQEGSGSSLQAADLSQGRRPRHGVLEGPVGLRCTLTPHPTLFSESLLTADTSDSYENNGRKKGGRRDSEGNTSRVGRLEPMPEGLPCAHRQGCPGSTVGQPHPDVLLLADREVRVQVHDFWRPVHGCGVPGDLKSRYAFQRKGHTRALFLTSHRCRATFQNTLQDVYERRSSHPTVFHNDSQLLISLLAPTASCSVVPRRSLKQPRQAFPEGIPAVWARGKSGPEPWVGSRVSARGSALLKEVCCQVLVEAPSRTGRRTKPDLPGWFRFLYQER